jgi:predicted ester cyclase
MGDIMVTTTEQATIINKFNETVWEKKDLSKLGDFFNNNAKFHSPLGEVTGLEAIKTHLQNFQKSFTDLRVEVLDVIVQNNKCCTRNKISGTCAKNFFGVETEEKKVSYEGVSLYLIENNKIQDCWIYADIYGLLTQLGAIPNVLKPTK